MIKNTPRIISVGRISKLCCLVKVLEGLADRDIPSHETGIDESDDILMGQLSEELGTLVDEHSDAYCIWVFVPILFRDVGVALSVIGIIDQFHSYLLLKGL